MNPPAPFPKPGPSTPQAVYMLKTGSPDLLKAARAVIRGEAFLGFGGLSRAQPPGPLQHPKTKPPLSLFAPTLQKCLGPTNLFSRSASAAQWAAR